MPVSKNRRKSKKAQRRKVNRARAESSPGWDGVPDPSDYPALPTPSDAFPEFRPMEIGTGGNPRYGVINPPDDPALTEMEQIDAIIGRSVAFEMTEAHHDNIGLREIDLSGETSGDDISGPMVATISVDPLSTIDGHPRWKTGQELIDFLDSGPNVFRGEFDGNRWQGLAVPWLECPPKVGNCPYRLEDSRPGTPPGCFQCERGMPPEEAHFHIVDADGLATLCKECWSKGPLPEEDRTPKFEFQFHGGWRKDQKPEAGNCSTTVLFGSLAGSRQQSESQESDVALKQTTPQDAGFHMTHRDGNTPIAPRHYGI